MKGKIIIVIVAVAIMSSSFLGFKYLSNTNKDVNVNFSEVLLDPESLVAKSDLIVSGKIKQLKVKETKVIKKSKDDEADIECTYSIYSFKVNDVINGKVPSDIKLVFAGSSKPAEIITDKDYYYFLEKDMLGEGYYHLTSYSQAVVELKGDKLVNSKTKEEFSKETLTETIKKHQK